MSDSKISALPAATSVAGTDLTVIVQGGVTKQAAVGLLLAGALLAFNDVADNPSKLALPASTPPGYPARITGEADRLEVFLGGDITQDASWAVLRNTVNLTAVNNGYADMSVNGVDCPAGSNTNVGWVDPTQVYLQSPSGANVLESVITANMNLQPGSLETLPNGPVCSPFAFAPREIDVQFQVSAQSVSEG